MLKRWSLSIIGKADHRLVWLTISRIVGLLSRISGGPRWSVFAGYAFERLGDIRKANSCYRRAVSLAKKAVSTASLRWLHPAQFFFERSNFLLGNQCPEDPLFSCTATPEGASDRSRPPSGFYRAEFVFSGLQIIGAMPAGLSRAVSLSIDGIKLKDVNLVSKGFAAFFSFKITRRSLRLFPSVSLLTVAADDGGALAAYPGHAGMRLAVPHGYPRGSPLLDGSRRMDKKGVPVRTAEELEEDRSRFLEIYAAARECFLELFGKHLFLIYGTLLGYYREGDFISGDDDFDAAFMAASENPVDAKKETLAMIGELLKRGFSVGFNRRGRLFRLYGRGQSGAAGPHLDIHIFWSRNGQVWAHNDFHGKGSRLDYVPAAEGKLRGVPVYIPADSELFLSAHYGPSWRTPDPGFVNSYAAADRKVLRHLSLALVTPQEYAVAKRTADSERSRNPDAGEFVSIGGRDLYPLTERDEDIE